MVAGPNVSNLPIRKADSPGFPELRLLCDVWVENSHERRDHVVRCTGDRRIKVVLHSIDSEKWGPHRADPGIWERFGIPSTELKMLCDSR